VYAIVRDRGKQYKLQEGDLVQVDLVPGEAGAGYNFGEVLLCSDGKSIQAGKPLVAGVSVEAVIEENPVRARKVITIKPSENENKRRQGHRQKYTLLRVRKINLGPPAS